MNPADAPTTVYRCRDITGALLYVGVAVNPGRRLSQHRLVKTWWPQVAAVELELHPTREAALAAEAAAIAAEQPAHNVTHNGAVRALDRLTPARAARIDRALHARRSGAVTR